MMKRSLIILVTAIFFHAATAQQVHELDSLLSIPQTIELKISTPQPRLEEKFQVSLDINYIRAHIFRSEIGKFEMVEDIGNTDDNLMILKLNAIKKGKQEIGPLHFTLNGTLYTTNKIAYEVIDPLPNVDKGLWFRKVFINDSDFCIIIEQRIPANKRVTKIADNTTKYWTEPVNNDIARFRDSYSVNGLRGSTSTTYSDFGSIVDAKGEQKQFMSGYSINFFKIVDKNIKIKITRDKFMNLPADYKFEDIVIQ